jgi:hypothetical protein
MLSARLGGDAFCAGEMCRQELSGSVQGGGGFVEDGGVGLEDVRYPGGDVEGDGDVGGGGLAGEADGVVEEHFVGSGLDDQVQGRQTSGSDGPDRPVHQATMTNLAITANGVFLGVVFFTGCGP